jgi:hypothetical protein
MEVMEKQELYKLRAQVFGLYPFVKPNTESWVKPLSFIELRSIDSLTYEEKKNLMLSELEDRDYDIWITDYLRSIGIALPYLGHNVEELVQLGIVKLK